MFNLLDGDMFLCILSLLFVHICSCSGVAEEERGAGRYTPEIPQGIPSKGAEKMLAPGKPGSMLLPHSRVMGSRCDHQSTDSMI